MECVANWLIICLTNCLTDQPTDCLINPSQCNTRLSVYPYSSLLSKGRHWSSHNKEFVAWVCKLLIDWLVSFRLSELLVDLLIDQFIYTDRLFAWLIEKWFSFPFVFWQIWLVVMVTRQSKTEIKPTCKLESIQIRWIRKILKLVLLGSSCKAHEKTVLPNQLSFHLYTQWSNSNCGTQHI